MKLTKKIIALAMSCAFISPLAALPTVAAAADKTATQTEEGYWQDSARYNYRINCPKKPLGVIPAKLFFDDNNKKGDVIIFETVGDDIFNVKTAWVVLVDAFAEDSLPDLTKLNDDATKSMLKKIQENNGYVLIDMVDLPNKNKGIYAITAKEVEIDSDNDGKVDAVAKTDNQLAVTFFRGNLGGRYCVQLIDNPQLRETVLADYQIGVGSLTEFKPDSKVKKSKK